VTVAARQLRPLGPRTLHVVVDMQRVFMEATDWQVPALADVVSPILALVGAHPSQTLFTRFVTPATVESAQGDWQRFYARWRSVVRDRMDRAMFDLIEPFAAFVPPAEMIDKSTYSAFLSTDFAAALHWRDVDTLVLSGIETDVCVLATALDAIDCGLRVVLAADAMTSLSAAGHRAALEAIYPRFDQQIEITTTTAILAAWPAE
jgi:nicotinamidase-related amidase